MLRFAKALTKLGGAIIARLADAHLGFLRLHADRRKDKPHDRRHRLLHLIERLQRPRPSARSRKTLGAVCFASVEEGERIGVNSSALGGRKAWTPE